jgi:DNA repair protein RadC
LSQTFRERLTAQGASSLSNAELIAIVAGTNDDERNLQIAARILDHHGGLEGLKTTSPNVLAKVKGIDQQSATSILAFVELCKRMMIPTSRDRPQIKIAADAAELLYDMRDLPQEHVRVILLDTSSRVMSITTAYVGTINTSVVRVSEIFREAITQGSAAIILAHNHPGGNAQPSPEDVELSRTLTAAGQLLDIVFVDHLIIAPNGWVSLKSLGLL